MPDASTPAGTATGADLPPAALVTGGAVRVGRVLVLALADLGFAVAIHCHRATGAGAALAAAIGRRGGRAVVVPGDLADPAVAGDLVGAAARALDAPLGVLVNNAATFAADGVGRLDPAAMRRQLAVNLEAPMLLADAFACALPAAARGLVVNLSDQRVANPTPHFLSYSVSKAGLEMMTAVLARALAPRIRVVNLALGNALPAPGMDLDRFAQLVAASPLGRATTAAELTAALAFIVRSPSMTGTTLTLDSGMAMGWSALPGSEKLTERG